jgi:hypothetical protein
MEQALDDFMVESFACFMFDIWPSVKSQNLVELQLN